MGETLAGYWEAMCVVYHCKNRSGVKKKEKETFKAGAIHMGLYSVPVGQLHSAEYSMAMILCLLMAFR